MDFTLTDINGQEKGPLEHSGVEFVLGTDNDFEIKIQESLYDSDTADSSARKQNMEVLSEVRTQ